jgi:uncharacterized membrane protein
MKPMQGTRRGVLIAIIILSSFMFFMFAIVFAYRTAIESSIMSPVVSPFVKYQTYFMISLGALGMAVGASIFYFMSQRVENTQYAAKKNAEVVLRFLSREEQHIIRRLLQEKGKVFQAELSRTQGLNKVKVHRILSKLAQKEIIVMEQYGKTNVVRLQPEIYDALS